MNVVLEWAKANIFIIVFAVVMVAALIALPIVSSGMNASVRDEVQSRAARLNELAQIERTTISMPGDPETRTGVVNQQFLDRYRERVDAAQSDANEVFEVAQGRNSKGRNVLMSSVFPYLQGSRDVLPRRFHERLMEAYDELIEELRVGAPPDPELVEEEITLRKHQFIGQVLAREIGDRLTDEEEERLREQLSELRLLSYQDTAERYSFYLPKEVLRLPRWDQRNIPSLAELFELQWRYWIHSDVLRALKSANENEPSLLTAPVKRVLRFEFLESPAQERGAYASGTGGMAAGGGGGWDPGSGSADPTAPPGEPNVDTKPEVQPDYSVSFTGRRTSGLYDVRFVELELVVETARIPEVFDALSQENFMTVIGFRMSPADPYEDARDGYFYGVEAVSRVSLKLETIWLRSWTAQVMPADTRAALGISSATAAATGFE